MLKCIGYDLGMKIVNEKKSSCINRKLRPPTITDNPVASQVFLMFDWRVFYAKNNCA